jgi:hypothetical protein
VIALAKAAGGSVEANIPKRYAFARSVYAFNRCNYTVCIVAWQTENMVFLVLIYDPVRIGH